MQSVWERRELDVNFLRAPERRGSEPRRPRARPSPPRTDESRTPERARRTGTAMAEHVAPLFTGRQA